MNNLDIIINKCINKDVPLLFLHFLQKKQETYKYDE